MKILFCHNFYQLEAGENVVVPGELEILRQHGHTVIEYTRTSKEIDDYSFLEKLIFPFNVIYSFRSVRQIRELVRLENPDVAMVQNVFPLISPSVYGILHKLGVPIVQVSYNYRFVCANGSLFTDGRICQACIAGSFWNSVRFKCYRESYCLSALYAFTIWYYRECAGLNKKISAFLSPSNFLINMLADKGFSKSGMFRAFNPFEARKYSASFEHNGYFLYFGRIVREKGIFTLLEAMRLLPDEKLLMVGLGEAEADAKQWVSDQGLTNVEFMGPRYGEEMQGILAKARAVIAPVEWFDVSPLVIYQAQASGKPVIASDLECIRELVSDEQDGLLFEMKNASDLAEKMKRLSNDEAFRVRLAHQAKRVADERFALENRYNVVMEAIQHAIDRPANA